MNDMSINDAAMIPVVNQNDEIVGYHDEVNRKSVSIGQEKSQFVASAGESSFATLTSTLKGIAGVAVCLNNPLLGLFLMQGCGILGQPSSGVVKKALEEKIETEGPPVYSMIFGTFKNMNIEEIKVVEIGNAIDMEYYGEGRIKLWPVKVHLKMTYDYSTILGGGSESYDKETEIGLSKDAYGKWRVKYKSMFGSW